MNLKIVDISKGYRSWSTGDTSLKVSADYLIYSADMRDSAESGMGHPDNHHLNYLAESISVNVGEPSKDVKGSSLPMPKREVGAAIVVRGWENQLHGKGPQSVGISRAK